MAPPLQSVILPPPRPIGRRLVTPGAVLAGGRYDTRIKATWSQGDFNYDTVVDVLDAADLIASGLFDAGTYVIPAATITAVPEPATWPLIALGAAAWPALRRAAKPCPC